MKRTAIKVTSLLTVILMTLSFVSCVREAAPPAGSEGIVFPEIESVESVHGSGTETDNRVSDTVDTETVTETETRFRMRKIRMILITVSVYRDRQMRYLL